MHVNPTPRPDPVHRHLPQTGIESKDLLESALALAHAGYWSSELGTSSLRWSVEVFRIFGVTEAEFKGTRDDFFSRIHPDDLQRVKEANAAALRQGLVFEVEHRILRPDGTVRWVYEKAKVVRDPEGRPIRMLGIVQDVTERRQLEAQLRQAQRMEAIGQLAGGVAHDFNNLLTVIRGCAEMALMGSEPEGSAVTEYIKQVIASAERAANLTRQLLAFSRNQTLDPQPVDLNQLVANLGKMLKRIITENILLECRYEDRVPVIQADPGMIEQVIVNLALNARDAMPQGGRLEIVTETKAFSFAASPAHPEGRPGTFVCLEVRDTGTGIAPEHLPHIFEPFFTTKEAGHGTGLGLATVYGIIKQHQGWIEVSTQAGAGTTFTVFLPAAPQQSSPNAVRQSQPPLRGGSETILLVEDEASVRLVSRRVLEAYGYHVLEASCAPEALNLWRVHAKKVDLLLTDVVMPHGLTGTQLAERLRADDPSLKTIFMSGYSPETALKDQSFLRRTRSLFLQKPCSARKILETVRRHLEDE